MRQYIANNKLSSDIISIKSKLKFNPIKKLIAIVFCGLLLNINFLFAQNTLDKVGLSNATPASVAYSLRQLSSTYTGPLVRIKVGSSFYDVYPDANTNNFSLSSKISASIATYNAAISAASANALSTIITGSTNASVAIWYDQSGNAKDVLTSSATGPKIITSGIINTMNGQPSIYFAAVSASTAPLVSIATVDYSTQQTATINAVAQNLGSVSNISGVYATGLSGGWGLSYDPTSSAPGYWLDGSGCNQAFTGATSTTPKIVTGLLNKSTFSSIIYENSILKGTKTMTCGIVNGTADNVCVGIRAANGGTRKFDGNITEVILFPTNLSAANQSILETNQNTTYFSPSVSITSNATNNTICAGSGVTFTAVASNFTTPSYQWKKNGTAISGEIGSTYTTTTLSNNDVISVDVIESSASSGSIVSSGLALQLDAGKTSSYPGTGTTWTDLSGNNKNATLTSDQSFSSANGGSIQFNGGNNNASLPLVSNQNTNITMQCWVNLDANSKGPFFKNGINNGYTFGVGSGGNEFNTGNKATMLFAGTRWIPTTTSYGYGWKFVTMTINASGVPALYIDKTLVSGTYTGTNAQVPTTGTYLGRNVGDDDLSWPKFNGKMAAAFFYNRELTALEIAQNYDATSNRLIPTAISSNAITITVNAIPTPTFTAQPGASACVGVDVIYTTQSGQSNYTWTVPGTLNTDYSITSGGIGSTSNTVTLKWLTSGSKTVTINYANASGCSVATATSSTATTVNALPTVMLAASFSTTNLLARYDATNTASLTMSGSIVTGWNDLSGNGYHLTQNGTGPTIGAINGVQALEFNSSKRFSRTSVPISDQLTILMVTKYRSASGTWGNYMHHGDHDADWSFRINGPSGSPLGFHSSNDNSIVNFTLTNNNDYILVGRMKNITSSSNNSLEYWTYNFNGTTNNITNTSLPKTITAGNKTLYVGSSDVNEASNAIIGEILYYNAPLSDAELTQTLSYLKTKWFGAAGAAISTTYCQNATANALSATATGSGITYQWYSNTTAVNSGGTAINNATTNTFTPSTVTAGTTYYYVVVTNANGCTATSSISGAIIVNPLATVAPITGTTSVCTTGTTALNSTTSGGTWSSSNTAVATIDETGLVKGLSAGTSTINYQYPADPGGSILFNGTNQKLQLTPGVGTIGTSPFTFECWFKLTKTPTNRSAILGSGTGSSMSISVNSLTEIETDAYGIARIGFAFPTMSINTWYHLAVVRNASNQETIFLNGVRTSTGVVSDTKNYSGFSQNIGYWVAGGYFPGLLTNIRAVVGTALYDPTQATITVPTFRLNNVANTNLLLRASDSNNLLTDASATQTTIGNTNTTTWDTGTPFLVGCPSIKTATVTVNALPSVVQSGSIGFNGTNQYLSVAANTNFVVGTGDYTIESWVYQIARSPGAGTIFSLRNSDDQSFPDPCINANGTLQCFNSGGGVGSASTGTVPLNTWTHVAFVRRTGVLYYYINGIASGSTALSGSYAGNTPKIGGQNWNANFLLKGNISNLRFVKGLAVYTGAFTPSNSPLNGVQSVNGSGIPSTAITNTSTALLLNTFYSSNYLTDNSANNYLVTAVNSPVSLSTNPFNSLGGIALPAQSLCTNGIANPLIATQVGSGFSYQWYQNTTASNTGGTLIPSATSDTYTPITTISGTSYYYVVVTNASGCSATSNVSGAITINAMPSSIVSNALNFDGTNDYVQITGSISGGNNFSYNTLFNANTSSCGKLISSTSFEISFCNGSLEVWTPGASVNVNTGITTNIWHKLSVTYNNPTLIVYLDGNVIGTNNSVPSIGTITNPKIGQHISAGCCFFNGALDETSFWNITLSPSTVASIFNQELVGTETGLTAYYNYNQGIALGTNTGLTSLTDKTGKGNSGALYNFALTGSTSNYVTSGISTTILSSAAQSICLNGTTSAIVANVVGTGLTYQWYSNTTDSNLGGTLISGASTNSYTPLVTTVGTTYYYVVITNASGCSATSNVSGAITVYTMPSTIVSNALNFDGTNDYMLSNASGTTLSEFTIEAYINPTISQNTKGLFQWSNTLNSGNPFVLFQQNGTTLSAYVNGGYNLSTTVPLGSWSHAALTYSNNVYTLYLNGVAKSTYNGGLLFQANATQVYLGNGYNGYWNGSMDEVRFWSKARTQTEIQANMNNELVGNENGLLAYYNFNQGTANGSNTSITTITDKSVNGYTGTLNNFAGTGTTSNFVTSSISTTILSSATQNICLNGTASAIVANVVGTGLTYQWFSNSTDSNVGGTLIAAATSNSYTPLTSAIGKLYYYVLVTNTSGCSMLSNTSGAITIIDIPTIGGFHNALDFNGSSSFVAIPQSNAIRNLALSTFSMEALVNVVNSSNVNSILRKTGDYNFFIYNQKLYTEIWTGGEGTPGSWKQYIGSTTIPSNTWTHVAAVWNGTTFTFYVNGVLDPSTSTSGSIGGTENLSIGKSLIYGNLFSGKMDEVRIWNTARTITEIQDNRKIELLGSETGLIAYYNFNQGISGGTNTSITTLNDNSANLNNGTLNNFTLTGSTNNFILNSSSANEIISSAAQSICKNNPSTALSANVSGTNLTYQWFSNAAQSTTGGTLISGANTNSYSPLTTASGVLYYYVVITNANGCSTTSNLSGAITIFPTTAASPITGADNVCVNSTITLSNLSFNTTTPFTVAYSLRRLKGTYTGYAIKVRRSSDGTESNIGFNLMGDLDEAALKTFTGSGNAFVSIWYDQSGNAKNMVQTNTNLQPQIVFSGVLKYIGTRPTIDFYLYKGLYYSTSSTLASASAVVKSEYSNWPSYHAILDANNRIGGLLENSGITFHYNQYPSAVWKNGTSLATNASLAPTNVPMILSFNTRISNANNLCIGNYDGGSAGGAILQSEVIGFATTASSSDRQNVEANQGNYYGITVASVGGSSSGSGSWSSDNTAIATINASTGVVTGKAAGTANINYTESDINGCQATASKVITVNPSVTPTFTASPTAPICSNNPVTYTTQAGQSNYTWTLSGTDYIINSGGIGTTSNTVTLTWTGSGNRTVTVNYSNSSGCLGSSPATHTLMVSAIPILSNIQGVSALGIGGNSTLSNTLTGGIWSSSNSALLSIGASSGELTGIDVGNAIITYTYTSPAGCVASITKAISIYNPALNRSGKINPDLTTYVARTGAIGDGTGLNQKGEIVSTGYDGRSPASAAKSAAEIKKAYPNALDGVYWIDVPGSGPVQTYCLMDSKYDGGGWMLALKATRGTTFNYDANYWTTTNTLNPTNVNRNDGDAKYDVMNSYLAKDMMALWPDIPNSGTESGSIDNLINWSWLQNNFHNSGATTTLIDKFLGAQTTFYTSTNGSMTFNGYGTTTFSNQGGYTWYGFNYTGNSTAKMRWGFAWNNEGDQNSNDVSSGIGMGTSYGQYSAGDKINCCQINTGINRSARVEIYIR